MSDQDRELRRRKLMDAINENCALESTALLECQDSWSLWNRMTLCQAFQSNYMDCLNTQRVVPLPQLSLRVDIADTNGIRTGGEFSCG